MTTTTPTTLRPDADHGRNRQGPSIHGYPVLRLASDDLVGLYVKTSHGDEFMLNDPTDLSTFGFLRPTLDALPAAVMASWAAAEVQVTVFDDGCYHVYPIEAA